MEMNHSKKWTKHLIYCAMATTMTVMVNCTHTAKPTRPIEATGLVGSLEYHRAFEGEGIKNRDIVIWLPDEYQNNLSKRYPVLYMHDGQNLFLTETSCGTEWRVDEICDSLINANVIAPMIVVGIYNTDDRMQEYIPGEKGTHYMNFIINRLKPYIDSTYRTIPDRESTFVGGASAGGTISFMLAWEHPEIFSKAICMSPALKVGGRYEIDYVKEVMPYKEFKKDLVLYLDNGGQGVDTLLQPGIDEMLVELAKKGFVENQDMFWIKDSTAQHHESAWSKRLPKALELTMKK